MNKKKILFVNGHMNVGGCEKTLLDLINNLDYNIYDIDLLLIEDLGDYITMINKNVNIKYFDTKKAYGPFIETIIRNIKNREYKYIIYRIIILLSNYIGYNCLIILKKFLNISEYYDYAISYRPGECANIVAYIVNSKKKFCWWHHGDFGYTEEQIKNAKIVWKHFNKIVTVSKACQEMIRKYFPLFSNKIVSIPNMIDINQLKLLAGTSSPFNKQKDELILVTVGRLYVEKHIENVIEVAQELITSKITNFKWYIIGDGLLYKNIKNMIQAKNLDNWIIMLGNINNPYPYIKYADILVHTSYIEAQCTTMLESMALKTPCVITRTINPQDFTIDNVNCLIAEQNIQSITQKIIELINNIQLKKKITQNAEKKVKEYSSQKTIKKFEHLINHN